MRMLDGDIDDVVEANSLSWQNQHIDIYSASWGPNDDGRTMEGPGPQAHKALFHGARTGRGGLGSVFVWAGGNGGRSRDQCNCDGYTNSIFSIAINAVDQNGQFPSYGERCTAIVASTMSTGSGGHGVVASDRLGGCTAGFSGTSAAAPLAAGIYALVLEANPCISWRDIQHITVRTSEMPHGAETFVNGAGLRYSTQFGFGKLVVPALIEKAESWKSVSPQLQFSSSTNSIHLSGSGTVGVVMTGCDATGALCIDSLEHVTVGLTAPVASVPNRGKVEVELISPRGTVSRLLTSRPSDRAKGVDFEFLTVACWGENPRGRWQLSLSGVSGDATWEITLHGTKSYPADIRATTEPDGNPAAPSDEPLKPRTACKICRPGKFSDGHGMCRSCDPGCPELCIGDGPAGCNIPSYRMPTVGQRGAAELETRSRQVNADCLRAEVSPHAAAAAVTNVHLRKPGPHAHGGYHRCSDGCRLTYRLEASLHKQAATGS